MNDHLKQRIKEARKHPAYPRAKELLDAGAGPEDFMFCVQRTPRYTGPFVEPGSVGMDWYLARLDVTTGTPLIVGIDDA